MNILTRAKVPIELVENTIITTVSLYQIVVVIIITIMLITFLMLYYSIFSFLMMNTPAFLTAVFPSLMAIAKSFLGKDSVASWSLWGIYKIWGNFVMQCAV